mgnify:CR=1 FL=1
MKRENDINKKISLTIISISALIILVQFIDSYCTEIFGRTQSLSVKEFLMDARGMGADEGVAYMSRMMLPFYLIGMLTPFVRSYADIVGRKVMLFINVAILVVGSVICMLADRLIIYLLGNGILILGYSLDIHMIYIVDMLPANRRATVRGIYVVLRAAAGHSRSSETSSLYDISNEPFTKDGKIHFIHTLKELFKQNRAKALLISICVVGLATAGIQYYNEPLLAFGGMSERKVNIVLLWQPVTVLVVNVIAGIAADRLRREYVVAAGIVLSLVTGCVFIFGVDHITSPALPGILWGCMSGFYYSSEELINMMVMESAAPEVRGRASAMSTFAYGIGNQVGIIDISLVVGISGMRWTKLIFISIPLVTAMIVLNRNLKIRLDSQV